MHYRESVVWANAIGGRSRRVSLGRTAAEGGDVWGARTTDARGGVESPREKLQFLSIAHGSAAELETQVMLCEQIGWFPEPETLYLRATLDGVSRILTTMRREPPVAPL